jgi:hypothetical protein
MTASIAVANIQRIARLLPMEKDRDCPDTPYPIPIQAPPIVMHPDKNTPFVSLWVGFDRS